MSKNQIFAFYFYIFTSETFLQSSCSPLSLLLNRILFLKQILFHCIHFLNKYCEYCDSSWGCTIIRRISPPCTYRFCSQSFCSGISKNNCKTYSGSPEVELKICPWLILFRYWTGRPDLSSFLSVPIMCMHIGARPKVSLLRRQDLRLNTRTQND